jgi:hypothetical protein
MPHVACQFILRIPVPDSPLIIASGLAEGGNFMSVVEIKKESFQSWCIKVQKGLLALGDNVQHTSAERTVM